MATTIDRINNIIDYKKDYGTDANIADNEIYSILMHKEPLYKFIIVQGETEENIPLSDHTSSSTSYSIQTQS